MYCKTPLTYILPCTSNVVELDGLSCVIEVAAEVPEYPAVKLL